MYLFFDTETNGLPKKYNGLPTDLDNWPRVIQLAWVLFANDGTEMLSRCNLITPDGWTIPQEKFWIDNGYTTERNAQQGRGMLQELHAFAAAINRCELMVAHNLSFDQPILVAEMLRYQVKSDKKPSKFCTMKATTNLCKLPSARGGYKWPKLEELHKFLFGVSFDGAHDALEDVRATARCFFELKKLGHISV
jgi:DNA polymerase-3 subunit epsilon